MYMYVIVIELTWLGDTYCVEVCQQWLGKVKEVQENVKNAMLKQMKSRFDILTIPDNTGLVHSIDNHTTVLFMCVIQHCII